MHRLPRRLPPAPLAPRFRVGTFERSRRAEASRMHRAIVGLINEAEAGSARAAEQLFTELYKELHRVAERQLKRSGRELTLGATTLLHEAYLNIAAREGVHFPDRARFMGYA